MMKDKPPRRRNKLEHWALASLRDVIEKMDPFYWVPRLQSEDDRLNQNRLEVLARHAGGWLYDESRGYVIPTNSGPDEVYATLIELADDMIARGG